MSRGVGREDPDTSPAEPTDPVADPEELATQVELLREENRRLRMEYARARQSRYRRSALGLAVVGLVAAGGAVLFPGTREPLFILAATGLFGAALTYYLTPERFVASEVGGATARTLADGLAALAADVGLSDERVYVPTETDGRVRLFVPQRSSFPVPPNPEPGFVVSEDPAGRGMVVDATGEALFGEFERVVAGPLADDLPTLADQLAEGLAEVFELVDEATPEVDGETLRVGVSGSALGPVDGFDHPVGSFVATGLARALAAPVSLRVVDGDDRYDAVVVVEPVDGEEGE